MHVHTLHIIHEKKQKNVFDNLNTEEGRQKYTHNSSLTSFAFSNIKDNTRFKVFTVTATFRLI